ncbi:hypothetical protein NXX90_03195 [Parabacteroides distasonis]|uniref:hypothetical protein n=1 Tax=Parabacteroides distasonis TaxID=823 RepID=UPI00216695AF|nr:hypothetical protein [Parabacteroides distasonis]MCS3185765.1 hypothetical protein [Parabacteroides distasonis]
MGETVIVTCLPGISSAPVVSLVPMVSKASVPFSGGGEGDGVRDLLVQHLYRGRVGGHGEGVGVSTAGDRRNRHRSGGRIRAADHRVAENHSVAGGGGGRERHLRAGMYGRGSEELLAVRREREEGSAFRSRSRVGQRERKGGKVGTGLRLDPFLRPGGH